MTVIVVNNSMILGARSGESQIFPDLIKITCFNIPVTPSAEETIEAPLKLKEEESVHFP